MPTRELSVHGAGLVSSEQASARQAGTDGEMQRRICQWRSAFAVLLLCLATAVAGHGQTFTSLASFNANDGRVPDSPLVQGLDGNLYGLTSQGARFKGCTAVGSCGSIFKITPEGSLTTFYAFCSQANCSDGFVPVALILATNGNFYGTTFGGGSSGPNCNTGFGCGTIFKITPGGALTTLYNFCTKTNCVDGIGPDGLVQASDGNLYGTTVEGGAHPTNSGAGGGTVFRITPAGVLTTLYSFCALTNCADGVRPNGLIQATNGKLYGTTLGGGLANASGTMGTAFSITPAGQLTTLYDFCSQPSCADGAIPTTAPIQAANGALYGTASRGGNVRCGSSQGCGTIFKLTLSGAFTTLFRFCAQRPCSDGADPNALLQAADGNFYGTSELGGIDSFYCNADVTGCGTIFKITASGALTTLYSFCAGEGSCSDGRLPDELVQATDGNFYGTTPAGGLKGDGTVFRLSAGLEPFVKTLPTSGKVGTKVVILGTDLTGATSVSFNGAAASFTVVSATQIKTTVPAGATTGTVTVDTPSGTLKSNLAFRVP